MGLFNTIRIIPAIRGSVAADTGAADEYDAAQERGEVAKQGRPEKVEAPDLKPTIADIGLSKQDISEARQFRDAERNEPGIARRAWARGPVSSSTA